jgi:peptidoglycan/xylan/chitin deacetylase (PgdA/CDA1 family)
MPSVHARPRSLRSRLKGMILHLSKALGLFALARLATRRGLRILCYHGVATADESAFRPKLFITSATLERRFRFLATRRFPVLRLDEALARLERDDLPNGATVITIDDGFASVYTVGLELLRKFSFPATLYLTTYYCLKEAPVFRLAIQYLFWKTDRVTLELTGLDGARFGGTASLERRTERDRVMWDLITYGETECDEPGRRRLARAVASRLAVDGVSLEHDRRLSLVSAGEIRAMARAGIDIQLHTHRHRLPEDRVLATREILDNKAALAPLVVRAPEHLCYPSGVWSEQHGPVLAAAGIKSATTCEPGLNYRDTPRYALQRTLDSEDLTQIEFEAEVAGYAELLRRGRSRLRRLLR